MVILTNTTTPEKVDNKLLDAMTKEIEAYWMYSELVKNCTDRKHITAMWEIMDDEFLHAKYLRNHMVEKGIYDMKEPYEQKYRDMLVDKMVRRYGWDD
jgi:rubrerythrin